MAGKVKFTQEAIVVILDVGHTMGTIFNEQGETRLQIAAQATKILVQQKLMFQKTHQIGIVIAGSQQTQNDLAESVGGYQNITVLQQLDIPTVDTMLVLNDLVSTSAQADILDALVVSMNMIQSHIGTKKFLKKIFVITDGSSPIKNQEQLDEIINQINLQDIRLNIIAVGFAGDTHQQLTPNQLHLQNIFTQLISGVKGQIYPSNTAMKMYMQFRKRSVHPVAKYKGPFDLGLGNTIDVAVYSKTKQEVFPSMKKHSTAVEFSTDIKEGLVKMSRESALQDDPTSTVIDPQDIIKAYYYGKSVVPVSKIDQGLLNYATKKCLKLLGFLPFTEIPPHYFMSGVDMVLPMPGCTIAFQALAQAMFFQQNVALVRYCTRDNQQPKLGVLSPNIKPHLICMWLNILPTAEEIRDFPFADLIESTPQQNFATQRFIDALSLDSTEQSLKPTATFNPALQYFYQCLTNRVEHPDNQALPPLDKEIENYLCPDRVLFTAAERECQEFASKFILKEVEIPKKEKRYYADMMKLDEKPDDLPPQEVTISEGNPSEDFFNMLKDRKVDRVGSAVQQMKKLISRLVEQAYKGNTYQKAFSCLNSLRIGCLDEDEIDAFNQFMLDSVKKIGVLHPEFWELLVKNGVSLISSRESDKSTVSDQEAGAFLVKVEEPPQMEIEDLLDDIE